MLAPSLPLTPSITLRLPLAATTLVYDAVLSWEAYANGDYQLTTIRKEVALRVQPTGASYSVEFRTGPPVFTKSEDPEPLEELAVRLSALYQRVLVQATPRGELIALLNHEALLHTWAQLAQDLRASTTDDDQLTSTLLKFMTEQLQSPAAFLRSLRHDYLYQTLVPDYFGQPLGGEGGPANSRQFANFFDKIDLWFAEQVTWEPGPAPEQLTLRLQGTLDKQKTDVEAVHQQISKALGLVPPPAGAGAEVPPPHFHYAATYVLETNTGLPFEVALSVYTRAGLVYNKEYTLTLTRQ